MFSIVDQEDQLKDFQVFIRQNSLSPEILVYDNFGLPYDNGFFEITIGLEIPVSEVIIKRPNGPLLLCEVEVYPGKCSPKIFEYIYRGVFT